MGKLAILLILLGCGTTPLEKLQDRCEYICPGANPIQAFLPEQCQCFWSNPHTEGCDPNVIGISIIFQDFGVFDESARTWWLAFVASCGTLTAPQGK